MNPFCSKFYLDHLTYSKRETFFYDRGPHPCANISFPSSSKHSRLVVLASLLFRMCYPCFAHFRNKFNFLKYGNDLVQFEVERNYHKIRRIIHQKTRNTWLQITSVPSITKTRCPIWFGENIPAISIIIWRNNNGTWKGHTNSNETKYTGVGIK